MAQLWPPAWPAEMRGPCPAMPRPAAVQDGAARHEGAGPRRHHQRRQRRVHGHPRLPPAVGWAPAAIAHKRRCPGWQPRCHRSGWSFSACALGLSPSPPVRLLARHLRPLCLAPSQPPNPPTHPPLLQSTPAPRPLSTASPARWTPSTRRWACACRTRRPCLWRQRCRRSGAPPPPHPPCARKQALLACGGPGPLACGGACRRADASPPLTASAMPA